MKKFPFLAALVLFAATIPLSTLGAGPLYHQFKSEAGGFSVQTPVALQQSSFVEKTGLLDYIFYGGGNNGGYSVIYFDYPEEYRQRASKQVLDEAIEHAQARLKRREVETKVVSEKPLSLDGHPGREVVVNMTTAHGPQARVKWHFFLVNNRLYMLSAGGSQGGMTNSEIDKFLDSFQLLSK